MSAKLVSKISIKSVGAQPAKNSIKEGERKNLMAIYGRAAKHETVTTNFGDSERFKGNFEATNVETGEVFKSTSCFLPGIVADILADGIDTVDGAVEFAFLIGAEFSEKGSTGYAFTVEPIRELSEEDSLAALRGEIQTKLKALPAPSQRAAVTTTDVAAPKNKAPKKK